MMVNQDDILDVAVVGGGPSGLYSAWRLLTGKTKSKGRGKAKGGRPIKKVTVFELSGRTGGRLLTWRPFPEQPGLNAELGGMRFYQEQGLVWGLINNHFVKQGKLQPPIDFYVTDPNGNNIWYLRENNLKAPDLTNPDKVPYRLDARARYADPPTIINDVIGRMLAANREVIAERLGGPTRPMSWQEWDEVKPYLRYGSRRMWDVGFWNLLWDILSPEGYNYVTDAFGYYSITNNWNAAEAMQFIYADFTGNPQYKTLNEGYDYLPYLVRQEFVAAGGEVRLNTPVRAVNRNSEGLMEVWLEGADTPQLARHVILAMPRRSLELLERTPLWQMDRVVGASGTLQNYLRSVIIYPAFKMFLAFETPWWRNPPISMAAGRTVSDQPIRQTYYFPPLPGGFQPGQAPMDGPCLVMASYDDLNAVPFWQSLEDPQDLKTVAKTQMLATLPGAASNADTGPLQAHIAETNAALADEPGFHYAPPEMVRYALEQLQLVHYNQPLPDPMILPGNLKGYFLAAYKDWGHDPFGGGWNFWAPQTDVRDVMQRIRRPFTDANLYIVGDAYSGAQGWVEGALTTAETMLREQFDLAEDPTWQPPGYYMGY